MKKKSITAIILLCACILLGICVYSNLIPQGTKKTATKVTALQKKYTVLEKFFGAYAEKDYQKLNTYLNPDIQKIYSKTVKSMPKATLLKIDKENAKTLDGKYYIPVEFKVETTKASSLWPGPGVKNGLTTTSEYFCVEKVNGSWLITDVTTG
ncbi:MAG: hypothetical protein K5819_01710 [Lachnospiraceae bacterium]|nr:hypothetical protein [Lachnospiraceae bacterium]